MSNVSHKRICHTGTVKIHARTPPTPPIKSKLDLKRERNNVRINFFRNPTSKKLDMYEFKMDFLQWKSGIIPLIC